MSAEPAESLIQRGLLGEALDKGPVAIFVADEDMRYVAVNESACELLGYTREELLSLGIDAVSPWPETRQRFADFMRAGSCEGLARVVRKDGNEVTVFYRASETAVAGMTLYVSVAWPQPEPRS